MTDPRNPLINGVTNVAGYRGDDKLPTSYAVNQLFSGEALSDNTNANSVTKCGNYRFNTTTTNLPTHMLGGNGILTVMHDRLTPPFNGGFGTTQTITYNPSVIRQVAWPDGPIDVTPYTRTYKNGSWGEWQTMGGGLRRVKMTANIAAANVQTNVMYYSFGAYTLNLPDPNTAGYSYGTKIGVEQYAGTGSVVSPNPDDSSDPFTIATSPTYQMNSSGVATSTAIGPTVYTFEVIEASNGTKQWMLDMDNDEAALLSGIKAEISNEALVRKNADEALGTRIDEEASTRGSADDALDAKIGTANDASTKNTVYGAIKKEAEARASADSSEASARSSADTAIENKIGTGSLSTGAVFSSSNTVDKAIQTEQTARANAVSAEASARSSADSSEASTRANADTAINNKIGTGSLSTGSAFSSSNTVDKAIQTEQTARANAVSAEASARASAVSAEASARSSADSSEASTRAAADNNKQKLEKIYQVNGWTLSTTFEDGNGTSRTIADLLNYVTPIIAITNGSVCWLPYAGNYAVGTKLTIEISGAFAADVRVANSSGGQADQESFTNSTGSILVLPFEVTYGSGSLQWSLLVAG